MSKHKWDRDGERCLKCGDKDWMGGPCSKSDEEFIEETKKQMDEVHKKCVDSIQLAYAENLCQWWIDKSFTEAKGHIQQRAWASDFERKDCIRVVEYSVYLAEKQRADQLREQLVEANAECDELERENAKLAKDWEVSQMNWGRDKAKLALAVSAYDEVVSYMSKVPTEPYEKQLAKEIVELRAKLETAENEQLLNFRATTDAQQLIIKDLRTQLKDTEIECELSYTVQAELILHSDSMTLSIEDLIENGDNPETMKKVKDVLYAYKAFIDSK